MKKAGVHDGVTNAITGHSDGTMRSRYDTVSLEDMMEGISKLEAYLKNVDQSVDQKHPELEQKAANLLN